MTKTATSLTTKCAICQKPARQDFKPFCSKRCQYQDLQKWLTGSYLMQGSPEDDAATHIDTDTIPSA